VTASIAMGKKCRLSRAVFRGRGQYPTKMNTTHDVRVGHRKPELQWWEMSQHARSNTSVTQAKTMNCMPCLRAGRQAERARSLVAAQAYLVVGRSSVPMMPTPVSDYRTSKKEFYVLAPGQVGAGHPYRPRRPVRGLHTRSHSATCQIIVRARIYKSTPGSGV
jgi:hypothetical protein